MGEACRRKSKGGGEKKAKLVSVRVKNTEVISLVPRSFLSEISKGKSMGTRLGGGRSHCKKKRG